MSARRTFTPAELAEIVAKHRKWRRGEEGGARANLAGANLANADLANADLADANLADADLTGAYLANADLANAYLAGANLADADLAGANLAGADLANAYLADADLTGADLADAIGMSGPQPADPPEPYVRHATPDYAGRARRYRERHPDIPVVEKLDSRILDAVTAKGGTLDMGRWHSGSCATTHCRAGWAITLAGEAGAALETAVGPHRAGLMIYRASTGRSPWFFAPNDVALEDIKACAALETETTEPAS